MSIKRENERSFLYIGFEGERTPNRPLFDFRRCMKQALCNQYPIPLIEDSDKSLGATYKGRERGTFGKFATLSLHGDNFLIIKHTTQYVV